MGNFIRRAGGNLKPNGFTLENLQYGRQRIILDYPEITVDNLFEVMQKALGIHNRNRLDCDYLIEYFLGNQDILTRRPATTSEINNKTVVNFAFPITREIVGYTFGSPTEFIPKDMEYQEDVKKLADIYNYEENAVDTCSGIYTSICGVGYMITLPSKDISKDMTPDIPIVHSFLDPRNTFVVQSTDVGNPTILSCNYVINRVTGKKDYTCYTDKFKFEFTNMNPDTLKVSVNPLGLNPITMIENSLFLTGDWEQAISVMNAQNQVTSDGLNDIEGTIKSILVILGAEFEDNDTGLKNVKEKRVLTLTKGNGESGGLDAKFIAPKLDSVSVENIRDYLEKARNIITGIPDRSANSSGGDTGMAVLNRDGWTDIEIVAKLKEIFYKKAKKEQISVGLQILKKLGLIRNDLSVLNIDLSVGGHRSDNIQTRTQAFAHLVASGEIATIDALDITGLTNKSREVVERGEKFRKDRQKEADERFEKQQEKTNDNDNDNKTDNKNNEENKKETTNKN